MSGEEPARPTYNHTREDSPRTPCPACLEAVTAWAEWAWNRGERAPERLEVEPPKPPRWEACDRWVVAWDRLNDEFMAQGWEPYAVVREVGIAGPNRGEDGFRYFLRRRAP